MMKFDHLNIPVSGLERSCDWYVSTLGLKVEFEIPDRRTVALQDSEGFAIFLQEVGAGAAPNGTALWFQVDDVDAIFAGLVGARRGLHPRSAQGLLGLWYRAAGSGRQPRPAVGPAVDGGKMSDRPRGWAFLTGRGPAA
jgi:catechol 2,3-dioxygenase-like lactoylglutathione lyase family enzyme